MKNYCLTIAALCLIFFTNCKKHDEAPAFAIPEAIEFTIPADSVKVNPNGYTPLSAMVLFTSQTEGKTFVRIRGRHGAVSDVTHVFNDFGTQHAIPVMGMYADTLNMVDVRVLNSRGDTLEKSTVAISTQALPPNMPSIVSPYQNTGQAANGLYLVSNFSQYLNTIHQPLIPYFMDDFGDIRWVLDYTTHPELSNLFYDNGIARLQNGNYYFGNTKSKNLYEVDILGNIVNTWPINGYSFHHEVFEEANGNFLVTVSKDGSVYSNGEPTIEDYIIEIDRNTKEIITELDLKESLNEYRRVWGAGQPSDWVHCNAILEDQTDNTIIVSCRNQGVIKLDRNNNIKWILAPHKDWGYNRKNENLSRFLLTPLDAAGNVIADTTVAYGSTLLPDFEWNCYQHSPILLPSGNLMLFDNGTNRTLDPNDGNGIYNTAPGKYSRAVEYKIDPVNMTVQQVWQYGKERDVSCYSSIISSVQYLPESNHVIFAPGFLVPNINGEGGKVIELDYNTKEVVNEISISSSNLFSAHRAKKMSLYPDNL